MRRRAFLTAAAGVGLAPIIARSQQSRVPVVDYLALTSPGSPLTVSLKFTDGKSLTFSQSQAKDIGDYVGPFVRQKCFRQIASGNRDYRDAFLVDFRPDADGKRQEIVVEFGTLFNF